MKLFTLTVVAAAIGMTGFAYAGGAKEAAKDATVVAKVPTVMTDARMQKIVAGDDIPVYLGAYGLGYTLCAPDISSGGGFLGQDVHAASTSGTC